MCFLLVLPSYTIPHLSLWAVMIRITPDWRNTVWVTDWWSDVTVCFHTPIEVSGGNEAIKIQKQRDLNRKRWLGWIYIYIYTVYVILLWSFFVLLVKCKRSMNIQTHFTKLVKTCPAFSSPQSTWLTLSDTSLLDMAWSLSHLRHECLCVNIWSKDYIIWIFFFSVGPWWLWFNLLHGVYVC